MLLEKFELTPTLDTAAFADGDAMGGLHEIDRFFPAVSVQGVIESIMVLDRHKQAKDFDIFFFRDNPSASTITNNAAFSLHDDDSSKLAGFYGIEDSDYLDVGGFSMAFKNAVNLSLKGSTNQPTLYLALVAREAIDYNTATDLTLIFTVRRD